MNYNRKPPGSAGGTGGQFDYGNATGASSSGAQLDVYITRVYDDFSLRTQPDGGYVEVTTADGRCSIVRDDEYSEPVYAYVPDAGPTTTVTHVGDGLYHIERDGELREVVEHQVEFMVPIEHPAHPDWAHKGDVERALVDNHVANTVTPEQRVTRTDEYTARVSPLTQWGRLATSDTSACAEQAGDTTFFVYEDDDDEITIAERTGEDRFLVTTEDGSTVMTQIEIDEAFTPDFPAHSQWPHAKDFDRLVLAEIDGDPDVRVDAYLKDNAVVEPDFSAYFTQQQWDDYTSGDPVGDEGFYDGLHDQAIAEAEAQTVINAIGQRAWDRLDEQQQMDIRERVYWHSAGHAS